jgi:hypothetical protein
MIYVWLINPISNVIGGDILLREQMTTQTQEKKFSNCW